MHVRLSPDLARSASAQGAPSFDGPRSRRITLLVAIIAVHFLIIAWLTIRPPTEQVRAVRGETLITVSASSGDIASAQPQRPAERPRAAVHAPMPPPLIPMPSFSSAAPEVGGVTGVQGGGNSCQLSADAAAAIQQDPVAMAELAALPPGVRSEADAVMLWNGAWFDQAPPVWGPTAAVEATGGLHSAIERIVAAAPARCRDEEIIGPVFVPIPEGERTTMLAIGSGVWRWSDLLPASPTCLSNEPAQCLKAPKVQ